MRRPTPCAADLIEDAPRANHRQTTLGARPRPQQDTIVIRFWRRLGGCVKESWRCFEFIALVCALKEIFENILCIDYQIHCLDVHRFLSSVRPSKGISFSRISKNTFFFNSMSSQMKHLNIQNFNQ